MPPIDHLPLIGLCESCGCKIEVGERDSEVLGRILDSAYVYCPTTNCMGVNKGLSFGASNRSIIICGRIQ